MIDRWLVCGGTRRGTGAPVLGRRWGPAQESRPSADEETGRGLPELHGGPRRHPHQSQVGGGVGSSCRLSGGLRQHPRPADHRGGDQRGPARAGRRDGDGDGLAGAGSVARGGDGPEPWAAGGPGRRAVGAGRPGRHADRPPGGRVGGSTVGAAGPRRCGSTSPARAETAASVRRRARPCPARRYADLGPATPWPPGTRPARRAPARRPPRPARGAGSRRTAPPAS